MFGPLLSGSEQNNSLYWFMRPVLVSFASLPVRRASRIYPEYRSAEITYAGRAG